MIKLFTEAPEMSLFSLLRDPRAYEMALNTLRDEIRASRVPLPVQDGVDFMTIYNHKRDFSDVLARAVSRGDYCTEDNPYLSLSRDGLKPIQYTLTDLILQILVVKITHEALSQNPLINNEPSFSDKQMMLQNMADYVKHHQKTGCDSFYIAQYNMRLAKLSPLLTSITPSWQNICRALFKPDVSQLVRDIIDYVYRPFFKNQEGNISQCVTIALQSVRLKHVFIHADLCELDAKLLALPTILYRRTLDKMVIIARTVNELKDVQALIQSYSATKNRVVELIKTKSVRLADVKKTQRISDMLVTPAFNFFDMAFFFDGSIGLQNHTLDQWFRHFELRLEATAALTVNKPLDERGAILVDCIHGFLLENIVINPSKTSKLMWHINNIKQLKYIDREIAFLLASILSGHQRTRSFNMVPGWKIRKVWKLKSIQYFLSNIHATRLDELEHSITTGIDFKP